jgi:hypothetical protein
MPHENAGRTNRDNHDQDERDKIHDAHSLTSFGKT